MVEFTLPRNSKIVEGKTWPHGPKAQAGNETEFRIYRWNPDA
ncbi:MAG TPA: succinate dehydrogenase iron-sulfur subunit, partial [Pseudolabrys sp.]|nr:succinate dehydrogenase iron-sulfur subunit [Pseudolabrys sp.]